MPKLWYKEPADIWEAALPLGNGRIGAMMWGGVLQERFSLNEDTLWSGYPRATNVPGAAGHYPRARELALAGKYREAQELIEDTMLGPYPQNYLPLGDLTLDFPRDDRPAEDYRRELELSTAVASVEYRRGGAHYTREAFVSAPDRALVIRLEAGQPGSLTFTARLSCRLRHQVIASGCRLVLSGIAPSHMDPIYYQSARPVVYDDAPERKGMRFVAVAALEVKGGSLATLGDEIQVTAADSVTIRLCARTSFNGYDKPPYTQGRPCEQLCEEDIAAAREHAWHALKARHIADHQALYNRVALELGESRDDLATPQRLARWEQDDDPGRFALLFQYGRYLMIASSRPGTTATNLQGIWNRHLMPPWGSNYTADINISMNYWPAESCNLAECHRPLFGLLEALRRNGAETARVHYGAGGFTAHHNTDIWAITNPVGEHGPGNAVFAFWPMAAGWLSAHAFQHYAFSLDEDFLRNTAWPIVRDAALFYLDLLCEDADGSLILCPAISPENCFLYGGQPTAVAKTTTMTIGIVRETLQNAVRCCDILGTEAALRRRVQQALGRMPAYRVGPRGELLEWHEALEEADPRHRHTSHLYPLHPGTQITPDATPALAEACRRTLELRGDESTGWALAWRVNLWARLGDGEHAYRLLKKQLRPTQVLDIVGYSEDGGCYPNLLGAHPPFQIDSNFGAAAGIAELLLQSHSGQVHLLPALPRAFGTGQVRGLRAPGALTVDITFAEGRMVRAALTSAAAKAQTHHITCGGRKLTCTLAPGEQKMLTMDDFS